MKEGLKSYFFVSYIISFFLLGCMTSKPKTFQELRAEDQMRYDPMSQEYRRFKDSELARRQVYKENTGVLITNEKVDELSVGDLNFSTDKYTYRFFIRMECERAEQDFFSFPLRNQKITWKIGSEAKGVAFSDNDGRLEFAYSSQRLVNDSFIEIEYQKHNYKLLITSGPMSLVIPKNECPALK